MTTISTSIPLSQTIRTSLKKESTTVTLNADEIAFLQRVVAAAPAVFDGLSVDDTISVSDVPKLAFIVFNLYKQHFIDTDINVNIINVVDFTLTILIQTLAPAESVILIGILSFCVELLRSNLPVIEAQEKVCCNWIRSLFSRCCSCCCVGGASNN